MKDTRRSDEFIDFDEIKSQREDIDIDIRICERRIKNYPEDQMEMEEKILRLKSQIPEVEAILATEPPAPELPPRQPLIKVSGVLEEFSVQKVKGYFSEREYSPEAFAQHEANEQLGGLLLAMVGNAAGSAATSQTQERSSTDCDFVRGKINGTPFYGWLGKTHVRVGDTVELAAMSKEGQLVVYALALPALRTLSITPGCLYGREGENRSGLRIAIPLFGTIFGLLPLLMCFYNMESFDLAELIDIFKLILMFTTMFTVLFFFSAHSTKKKPNQTLLLAENIFTTFEMDEPEKIDLHYFTKKKLKALAKQPPVVSDREMPARSAGYDYLFYY